MVQVARDAEPVHAGGREGARLEALFKGADSNDVEFEALCKLEAVTKYDSTLIPKSIKLLIQIKRKPWTIAEDDDLRQQAERVSMTRNP